MCAWSISERWGVTRSFAEFIASLSLDNLPKEVIERGKLLILDDIACAVGGKHSELGDFIVNFSCKYSSPAESTLIGGKTKIAAPFASFSNAVLANALDYDDTGAGGHTGATVVPAALAVSEKADADGKQFLLASIAGYEVAERIGDATQPSWEVYEKVHGKSHQTFGAAAASCKIYGMTVEEIENALGVAGVLSPIPSDGKFGLTERPITWIKDNVAWASLAGVFGVELSKEGFTGSKTILDGDKGFWRMICSDKFEYDRILDFNKYWMLRISFKLYPCCRWLHTTLDALSRIVESNEINPSDVKEIEVNSIEQLVTGFHDPDPKNMVDAEFSVQYPAIMVLNKIPRSRWYDRDIFFNPDIRKQLKKVRITRNEGFTREFMKNRRKYFADYIPSKVIVRLNDGSMIEEFQDFASGSLWNPASRDEIVKKARDLLRRSFSEQQVQELVDIILNLEDLSHIGDLTGLLAQA